MFKKFDKESISASTLMKSSVQKGVRQKADSLCPMMKEHAPLLCPKKEALKLVSGRCCFKKKEHAQLLCPKKEALKLVSFFLSATEYFPSRTMIQPGWVSSSLSLLLFHFFAMG